MAAIFSAALELIIGFQTKNGVWPERAYVSVNDAKALSDGVLQALDGASDANARHRLFGRQCLHVTEWYFDPTFDDGRLRLESADVREEFILPPGGIGG